MYKCIRTLVLVSCLTLFAFGKSPTDKTVITLERTTCFGTCPAYKLTIHGNGSVVYEGRQFVRVKGTRETTIDKESVAKFVQAFRDAGYFEMKDHYRVIQNSDGTETTVTDLPTTYTSLTLNGRSKAVEDYFGGPKMLADLERKIDEVADSKRWVAFDAAARQKRQ